MRVTPVNLEKLIGRYIEEASVIYPSRNFRVVRKSGVDTNSHYKPDSSAVNVEVDKHDRIVKLVSYG